MRETQRGGDRLTEVLVGAAVGAVSVWVMDRVDWFNFRNVDPAARGHTQAVRPGGMDPAHVAAHRIARSMGYELEPREHNPLGILIHYGIGIGPAVLYSLLRHDYPAITTGRGLLFGLGLFVAQDEGMNATIGLSAGPEEYPWQAHARGFVAHATYGLALDVALTLADRFAEGGHTDR